MTQIALENVTKAYLRDRALDGVTLAFPDDVTTAVVGGSGSGKSTLLQLINGLVRPSTGQVFVFGKPIGAMQLTQQKLADMATAIVQGRLLAHRLGTLKDQGRLHPVQVSITKRANVRAALDIARSARTILGANGITLEYPVSRHMANLESVLTYEGTHHIHTLVLGRALTGQNAFE